MANWFSFAGVTSTGKGVYVQDFPPATLPEERAEFVDVPGRSGSLTVLEGDAVYDDIILTINCYVRDLSQLDAISAWLRGSGELVLGNMPDRYYVARCVNQIEIAKLLRASGHRTFAAVFRCQPYRYAYPAAAPIAYLPLTNLVTNGDFSDGSTGWTAANATFSVVAGEGVMLASAAGGGVSATIEGLTSGRSYYFAAKVKSTSSSVRLQFSTTTVSHSGNGQYARISEVHVATGPWHTLSLIDSRSSGWNNVYVDNIIAIDLTAAFSAGNEPTAAQMDAYMADRYAGSWFSGTAIGSITNVGTADATPFITVVGSGDIDLTIGDRTIHIDSLASEISIDCDAGMAYNGTTNLTSTVTFDRFPWTIPPGISTVSWTGSVTSVTITRPWRYI